VVRAVSRTRTYRLRTVRQALTAPYPAVGGSMVLWTYRRCCLHHHRTLDISPSRISNAGTVGGSRVCTGMDGLPRRCPEPNRLHGCLDSRFTQDHLLWFSGVGLLPHTGTYDYYRAAYTAIHCCHTACACGSAVGLYPSLDDTAVPRTWCHERLQPWHLVHRTAFWL